MLRKNRTLCMNVILMEYLHDRQVQRQAPAVPRQLPIRLRRCQGRERKTKWQREMEGRRNHRHRTTGLGFRSVLALILGQNSVAMWSVVKSECRR